MSESSEEENVELLREAADNLFLNDAMFVSSAEEQHYSETYKEKRKSLRPCADEENHNVLRVTPEFQKFVAMRLMKIIDSQVKEVMRNEHESKVRSRSTPTLGQGGIRLFGCSTGFLCDEVEAKVEPVRKKTKRHIWEEEEHLDKGARKCRLLEAAVTSNWILSQDAVHGWETNAKGEVILLKKGEVEILDNGILGQNKPMNGMTVSGKRKRSKKKIKWADMEEYQDEAKEQDSVGNQKMESNEKFSNLDDSNCNKEEKLEKKKAKRKRQREQLKMKAQLIEGSDSKAEEKKEKKRVKRKRQREMTKQKIVGNGYVAIDDDIEC